jgi:hypothetical protein
VWQQEIRTSGLVIGLSVQNLETSNNLYHKPKPIEITIQIIDYYKNIPKNVY